MRPRQAEVQAVRCFLSEDALGSFFVCFPIFTARHHPVFWFCGGIILWCQQSVWKRLFLNGGASCTNSKEFNNKINLALGACSNW